MSRQILTHKQLNPIPYIANFYGENLHMDQNEKLVMFRVVHVLGIDGYSRNCRHGHSALQKCYSDIQHINETFV